MTTQSEAILENNLIKQLARQGYEQVLIKDEDSLLSNLKKQLEKVNNTTFSDKEFDTILNHLAKGTIFEKSKTLRSRFQLTRDDGESLYIRFFFVEDNSKNRYQVSNQIAQEGTYKNRYDVTILINGFPVIQIELKKRGIELKEAFKQICRYKRQSFWVNKGLFQYVQLFVISNGGNTKYYANNPLAALTYKQTFFWADVNNKNITELVDFAHSFLDTAHLGKMIGQYIVHNETYKILMALRPYQFYATEAMIHQVQTSTDNGYIWHTTGSGKTLTSFKASQIIMDLPEVHKVVFVVDRKDLDYQTMKEFNSFKKDSVDVTNNTQSLVDQFVDPNSPLILTTIQKLNNAISSNRYTSKMTNLRNKRIVFIFDECHRSQFGTTHQTITDFFGNSQLFGFTGTPIFVDNAQKNDLGKRTTKDLFDKCLHKYVITDAIRDQNVLRFGIEYIGRYKQKGNTLIDIDVEDIDTREVLDSPKRIEKIVDYIIQYHNTKTTNREFSAMLAVSSIDTLITYYELFKKKKEEGLHNLRIATIYSYGANETDLEAIGALPDEQLSQAAEPALVYKTSHSREKLDEFIADYNQMYRTSFSTKDGKQFENYFKDISKRLKEREKENFKDKDRLDIVIIVNMMLTGFDAKKVNTLYVDKNLRYHGLIQAYSRTNRILNEKKSQGNIVCFRNLKEATDEAILLFSNKEAKEEIILPDYDKIVNDFNEAVIELLKIAPTYKMVDNLVNEDDQLSFVQAFRKLMRLKNVLESFVEFSWEDLAMTKQTFYNYLGKYLDLRDQVRGDHEMQKTSILEDVDFELELVHRDIINVAYILKLIAKIKEEKNAQAAAKQKKNIMDLLTAEVTLRSKRELIEKFISQQLPLIDHIDRIEDEFQKFWNQEKVLALGKLCEEENLDQLQFQALINAYVYSGKEPIREEVFKCLDNRPSVLKAREIGERIINKMKNYIQTFIEGMVG
ncbi:type I restriction endonuclease subunit R [Aquimarina algiphila]|uniref:Type I restriction enzyme endonuclease subunit n=1 Tax=Aquimarina algiphila TaxID=2047982 RepID=A0A554VFD6_9FLAO|nr:type I restriction endonuclease subunit R [Aquimarina algiphila]TSE05868.1 type I restriction endonuclease subunit R [Aquimarina algiphila]